MVDKLERLLNLTLTLLETAQPLTSTELRERVPGYPDNEIAFRRAFERDKESLREMGVPLQRIEISHTDPPTEGYRIRAEDYYLKDPGFEPDEIAAINLAATAVHLETTNADEGLWKLGSLSAGAALGEADTNERGTRMAELPADPNLGPLFGAVASRSPVTFTYNDAARTVDPHRLDYQRGRWYLTGYDHGRADERNFRVDRIEGSVVVGEPKSFTRPETAVPGGPAQPWQFGEGEPTTAFVLVDHEQAPWMRRQVGSDAVVETRDDGAIVVRIAVTNGAAFRSFVLTFLDHAEVLAPPELRRAMVEWLEPLT